MSKQTLNVFTLLVLTLLSSCEQREIKQVSADTLLSMEIPEQVKVDLPPPALVPLPGSESFAPPLTERVTVMMRTGTGDITIEVYPQAAPNAAARFLELVESGFYDYTPVFRVVPDFVAQFGINWRNPHAEWENNYFDDDPSYFALRRGTLAFAKAGPHTNSTQVFISYVENNQLADPQFNFTAFAAVVEGMNTVDKFVPVGEPSGGLNQYRLWNEGDEFLKTLDVQPVMIQEARIVPPESED